MKAKELREMSVEDLNKKLEELTKSQFESTFASAISGSVKPHVIKTTRRDIARVKTILTEKAGK